MLGEALYLWLVVVGVLDACLVAPAMKRAPTDHTFGRLVSTLAVLIGLVLGATGRLFVMVPLHPVVVVGLVLIDVGLLGYALFLPERGLLGLLRRWRP